MVLFPAPKFSSLTSAGALLSGGLLYTYAAGTTTPLATYTDAGGLTANANPIVLDARGEANVWFDGSKLYKLVLKTAADVTIWTVDNVGATAAGLSWIGSEAGSVRQAVEDTLRETYSVKRWGAVCDGTTDDYAAIMLAHANAPLGSTILIPGPTYFTTPIVFTRRVNWVCVGENGYFKPDLETTEDAITFTAVPSLRCDINIFSAETNNCKDGLVFTRCHYARVRAWVGVDGAGYSFRRSGCLLGRWDLTSSVNVSNPTGPGLVCVDHMLVELSTGIGDNGNRTWVLFEGGGDGVTETDQANQGSGSTWHGCMEGLVGKPFVGSTAFGMGVDSYLYLESNSEDSVFTGMRSLNLSSAFGASGENIDLVACASTRVGPMAGVGITIDADCTDTDLQGPIVLESADQLVNNSITTIQRMGARVVGSAAVIDVAGMPPMAELFHNPYVDLWPGGASATPSGFGGSSITYARNTATTFSGNPMGVSVAVTSTATSINAGAQLSATAPNQVLAEARRASIMVPVYVATGQPNLRVYLYDGTTRTLLETITVKDTWKVVRGGTLIAASGAWTVEFRPHDGSAFVAGNYFVGGGSLVNGEVSPKFLFDDGIRRRYYETTGSGDIGDNAVTLTVKQSPYCNIYGSAITADRAVALSTTGAVEGDEFVIIRGSGATGAFNINIGTGPLIALGSAGSAAKVRYVSSAWRLSA